MLYITFTLSRIGILWRIPLFFLYGAILIKDFSFRGFSAFNVWQTPRISRWTYTTSNNPKFFTNFSQSVLNQATKPRPLAVCGLLVMMNGSDLENGTHRNKKKKKKVLGLWAFLQIPQNLWWLYGWNLTQWSFWDLWRWLTVQIINQWSEFI